jgi:hypothetical protein
VRGPREIGEKMDRLLNVLTVTSGVLLVMVLVSLRRAHIRVEYSVSWLVAAAALLILSRSRGLLESFAHALGLSDPPLALLLVVGCVFLLMSYRYSIILSKLRDDNIALAQRLAILEYHLQQIKDGQPHA